MASYMTYNSMSEELVENDCNVCMKKGQRREADRFCLNCQKYFCSRCLDNMHDFIHADDGHKIIDKKDFQSVRGSGKGLPSVPTMRCSDHQTAVLNLYCRDHDDVLCYSCVALNHRSCTKIESIPENVDILYDKSTAADIKSRVTVFQENLRAILKRKCNIIEGLKTSLESAEAEVLNFKTSLQKLIDKSAKETTDLLKKEFGKSQDTILTDVNEIQTIVNSIDQNIIDLEEIKANNAQKFVCVKICEKLLSRERDMMKKLQVKPLSITFLFTADTNIRFFLENHTSLGNISLLQTTGDTIPDVFTGEEVLSTQVNKDENPDLQSRSKIEQGVTSPSLFKVQRRTKIDVKLQDDRGKCSILGSCLKTDEPPFLLLADFNNIKLKRVCFSKSKVKDYITLEAGPRSVCLVDNFQAAVSLNNNTVQFVYLGENLMLQHSLRFDHDCCGLAFCNSKLYISDTRRCVFIHDMNGKEIRRITRDSFGRDLFNGTRHIAISAFGDRVYVADLDNGLIILDIEGNHLRTLSKKDIKISGACGVCTGDSNVFVCGCRSGNLVQIGNSAIGHIAQVKSPVSLCYAPGNSRLYVTSGDRVKVLELV